MGVLGKIWEKSWMHAHLRIGGFQAKSEGSGLSKVALCSFFYYLQVSFVHVERILLETISVFHKSYEQVLTTFIFF